MRSAVEASLDRGRVALVTALLVASAWGLRARATSGQLPVGGPLVRQSAVLVALLVAIAFLAGVALLVASVRLVRRMPEDSRYLELPPYSRWSRPLAVLAGVTLAQAPLTAVVVLRDRSPGATSAPVTPSTGPGPHVAPNGATGHVAVALPAIGVASGIVALLILLALVGGIGRGGSRRRAQRPGPAAITCGDEPRGQAQATLDAGRSALAGSRDPRAGIVACYAAMERALAGAGAAPQVADTPAEVLARVTGASPSARRAGSALTVLFREARYSAHPVSEADRRAADALLAQLELALGGQR